MLHAKVLLADGSASLGSRNFDERSFALDAELNLSVTDAGADRHFRCGGSLTAQQGQKRARWRY
jgi:phosphatidylserine/phosphatidylglycerophosphate/cardiolipin synthase-like enzyme